MKGTTKTILAIVGVLATVAQTPAISAFISAFCATHPAVATIGFALTTVGALLHSPTATTSN
jgi:hypothetical protein